MIARAVEAFGGLDILVNNAGGPPPGDQPPALRLPRAATTTTGATMLEFNLLSAVRACRAAIPLMLERGGGAIVNVSSVHAASRRP